ncbi:MAG: alanine--tRNA ligase, partial [Thaumarchaeota archaeon]|nr:alanine--tRNA ligase [Nitrososphaerota archaeon]
KHGISIIEDITIELSESNKANFCYSTSNDYDDVFHIGLGEVLCKADPKLVYCGLFEQGEKIRVIVYAGENISKEKSAGEIVKSISQILGGAGGGSPKFAQGGGIYKSKKEDAIKNAKSMINE